MRHVRGGITCGEPRGRLDDGPEPDGEVDGGSEARDPDPRARELSEAGLGRRKSLVMGEQEQHVSVSLVGGELKQPGRLNVVLRDPGTIRVHQP